MRRLLLALLCLTLATPSGAGLLVLRDGRALRIRGDYRVMPGTVVFWLEDGTFASLQREQVDLERSRRANQALGDAGSRAVLEQTATVEPAAEPAATPEPGAAVAGEQPEGAEGGGAGAPREFSGLGEEEQLLALLHTSSRGAQGGSSELVLLPTAPDGVPPGPAADSTRAGLDAEQQQELLARLEPPPDLVLTPRRPEAGGTVRRFPVPELAPPPAPPEPSPRELRLAAPRPGEAVWGPTPLLMEVPDAQQQGLERVAFRVDGELVAELRRPPWRAQWQAPEGRGRPLVSAELSWRDGRSRRFETRVRQVRPDASVDVNLVPLNVTVLNREQVPVTELGLDSFVLYEDGVRQVISHFRRRPLELAVALLVDLSFSMHGQKLDLAGAAARGLLQQLEPDDQVALWAFDDQVRSHVPLSSEWRSVEAQLGRLEPSGGTALFDTALEALEELAGSDAKRVLIVLSDGEDYHSRAAIEAVLRRASELNALIYAIGVEGRRLDDGMPRHWTRDLLGPAPPRHWSERLRLRGIKLLRRLCEQTGGVLYLPRYVEELAYVYRHVHHELRNQYELGYYSSNRVRDGGWRRISLWVGVAGYEARTRQGYHAPGAGGAALAER